MSASRLEALPVREATIAGVLAYVAGSVLVFPLLLAAGPPLSGEATRIPVVLTTLLYTLFHAWPVVLGASPALLLFAILPGGILTAAGYSVAARTSDASAGGPARGASIAGGYLAATVLAVAYFLWRRQTLLANADVPASAAGAIPPVVVVFMVLFTGIVFPVVFGAFGGMLAERRGH